MNLKLSRLNQLHTGMNRIANRILQLSNKKIRLAAPNEFSSVEELQEWHNKQNTLNIESLDPKFIKEFSDLVKKHNDKKNQIKDKYFTEEELFAKDLKTYWSSNNFSWSLNDGKWSYEDGNKILE